MAKGKELLELPLRKKIYWEKMVPFEGISIKSQGHQKLLNAGRNKKRNLVLL